jgi:tyrosyl-tRNA synthetase
LPGLSQPDRLGLSEDSSEDLRISSKMSKSKPSSAIMIHDDEQTINEKMHKAFCPSGVAEDNPVLELVKYVIFHQFTEFIIERPSKYGGNISYTNYKEVEHDFIKNKIHPMDLKNATAVYINKIIKPVRNHFKGRKPKI